MDLDLSEEQLLLKNTVQRLLKDKYSFDARKTHTGNPSGYSEEIWRQFADLGLLSLPFSADDGGLGGGPVEMAIVMEAFGGALVVEPYLATVILSGGLLRHAGSPTQRAALIPAICAGTLRLAFAFDEPDTRYETFAIETEARRDGTGWLINGLKTTVLNGGQADHLIVAARTSGKSQSDKGITLFLVKADSAGLQVSDYATHDGFRAADITLRDVRVGQDHVLGIENEAAPLITRVIDEAIAALCSEAVGCIDRMLEITVDYMKTRKQFGAVIGSFQALQHRAAEMFVESELARSMSIYAAMMVDESDCAIRSRAMSAAKIQIGASGRAAGQAAVQLHGGIGMTMENAVGHYFKRLTAIDLLFGNTAYHLSHLSAQGGLQDATAEA